MSRANYPNPSILLPPSVTLASHAPAGAARSVLQGPGGPTDGPGGQDGPVSSCSVRSLVLFGILDHYTRRPAADGGDGGEGGGEGAGAGRVIGTLLGKRYVDDMGHVTVEVTNCFAVPHAERGDEVAIGKDFNRQMLALHTRANRGESVVGWYATPCPETGRHVVDTSSLIHEFYSDECSDPVHLVVDAALADDRVGCRAYTSSALSVGGAALANAFHEVRVSLGATEPERICVDRMVRSEAAADGKQPPANEGDADVSRLRGSMETLLSMLESAGDYVDGVVDGSAIGDDRVGREVADTLASMPKVRPEAFAKAFEDGMQDLLMVTYLSNLTRAQLAIAEKLNATLGV